MDCQIIKQFPAMEPWVGKNYRTSKERLLVFGESHFLPPDSKIHHNASKWYQSSQQDLNEEEIDWINTKGIISYAIENDFNIKSHWIYKNIAQALNSLVSLPAYKDTLQHIVFSNYFKRPAVTGDSLIIEDIDKKKAKDCCQALIREFKPTIVIFTSSLSGKYGEEVVDGNSIAYFTVPHPTSQWWNRSAEKYYGNTGKELFIEFLKECNWII